MSFIKRVLKSQDLGEQLRARRSRLRLSPEDICRLTKIQPKYLLALESGFTKDLPATVYVKGFLRTLAEVYRVPAGPLIEQFVAERGIVDNVQHSVSSAIHTKKLEIPRFVLSPKMLTIGSVALLGLVSLAYLYFQVSSLARAPRLIVDSPKADSVVNSSLLTVTGHTEPGSTLYINNQTIVVDANGIFSENLSLGLGLNLLAIRAVNKFGQETTLARQVIYEEKKVAGSSTVATSTAAITLEVSIGPRSSFVELFADGEQIFSGVIPADTTQTFTAERKILFSTSDAGTTRLRLNGKDLGVLGKEGEAIRNIEFTK